MYDPTPARVIYVYQEWSEEFQNISSVIPDLPILFIQGSDLENTLSTITTDGEHTLIVIDDSTIESGSSQLVANMFMRGRHRLFSTVLMWHTLFNPGKTSRLISLNTAYFVGRFFVFLLPY